MATLILTGNQTYTSVEEAVTGMTVTMEDFGRAIGATAKVRPIVSIDLKTMDVYLITPTGRLSRRRFGRLLEYVERPNLTPTGGRYISRRVTVLKSEDSTRWVGQYKNGAETVILRPLNGE